MFLLSVSQTEVEKEVRTLFIVGVWFMSKVTRRSSRVCSRAEERGSRVGQDREAWVTWSLHGERTGAPNNNSVLFQSSVWCYICTWPHLMLDVWNTNKRELNVYIDEHIYNTPIIQQLKWVNGRMFCMSFQATPSSNHSRINKMIRWRIFGSLVCYDPWQNSDIRNPSSTLPFSQFTWTTVTQRGG